MPNSAIFPRRLLLGFAGLMLGTLALPLPAHAGFQWVAPETGMQAPPPSSLPSAPPPSSLPPAPPSTVVIQGSPSSAPLATAPVTRAPQTLQPPSEPASGAAREEHVLVPPPSAIATPAPAAEEKIVQGFADNVPLAVALRQILPSEYGYSVAQDVQLSTLVSWKGGRSWRPILEDMLREKGLTMREQGKMIRIGRSASATAPAEGVLTPPPSAATAPSPGKPMSLVPPSSAAPAQDYAAPAAASPYAMADTWTANRGETLHKVLENWSRRANVDISWQAEYDYPIQAAVTFTGTFEEAVRNLLTGFQEAQPQPVASLHNNPAAGQTVLVVEVRGNNYDE